MAIMDQYCFCCVSLRKGALVSSILFLLVSAATALLYVWGLLLLLQQATDFDPSNSNAQQTSILVLIYIMIGMHAVVMILASLILFIGAFCYSAGSAAFFSIIVAIGTMVELGCIIYLGVIADDQLKGLGNEPYLLFLVIWYAVRAIWNLFLVITSWSLFQEFNSKGYKAGVYR